MQVENCRQLVRQHEKHGKRLAKEVFGTVSDWVDDDRRRYPGLRFEDSRDDRYEDAPVVRALNVCKASLNSMRLSTGSQCSLRSSGMASACLSALATILATLFCGS